MLSSAAAVAPIAGAAQAGGTSGNNNPDMNTLRFRRPCSATNNGADRRETIFPPTVFTDVKYTRGILIPNTAVGSASANDAADGLEVAGLPSADSLECDSPAKNQADQQPKNSIEDVAIQIPNDYFGHQDRRAYWPGRAGGGDPRLPSLSTDEAARWIDKHAAHAAARRRSPMNTVRLLGTITLHFEEKVSIGSL